MTESRDCEFFGAMLDESVEGPLDPDCRRLLDSHLSVCAGCRSAATGLEGLSQFARILDDRETKALAMMTAMDARLMAGEIGQRAAGAEPPPLVRPADVPVFAALAVASALVLLTFVLGGGSHAGILVKTILAAAGTVRDLAGETVSAAEPGRFPVFAAGFIIVLVLLATPGLVRRWGRGWH